MPQRFRILCDESCHLESDPAPAMVLGAIKVPESRARAVGADIRKIKAKHGLPDLLEVKWTNASPAKAKLYLDLLEYFFETPDLSFRAVAAYKDGLRHDLYNQTHREWFFKIYYLMLRELLSPGSTYEIFIDRVDTLAGVRSKELLVYLNRCHGSDVVEHIQVIDSKRSQLMQLTDILVGAIGYAHREKQDSAAKRAVVDLLAKRAGMSLLRNSSLSESKFNLFHWDQGIRK